MVFGSITKLKTVNKKLILKKSDKYKKKKNPLELKKNHSTDTYIYHYYKFADL